MDASYPIEKGTLPASLRGTGSGLGTLAVEIAQLTKPTVVVMYTVMAAAGMLLAPGSTVLLRALAALIGVALAVSAANSLNMVLDRDMDRRMRRTCHRPLAAGRLAPWVAICFGLFHGTLAIGLLWTVVNPLSALLAICAMITHLFLYTPLKRSTHLALIVGAVPGAIAPLIGWTAISDAVNMPGLVLFGIALLWQVAHLVATDLYRADEHTRAEVAAVRLVFNKRTARWCARGAAVLLLPVSVFLLPLGVVGWTYAGIALAAGLGFLAVSLPALTARAGFKETQRFLFASLVYLPALGLGLMLNTVLP